VLFTKSPESVFFNQPFVDAAVTFNQLGAFVHTSILKLPSFRKPEMFPKSTRALSIVRLNTGHTVAVTLTPLIEPVAVLDTKSGLTRFTLVFQLVSLTLTSPITSANAFQAFKIKIPTIETKAIAFCIFVFI
jgi:hypothetical protein